MVVPPFIGSIVKAVVAAAIPYVVKKVRKWIGDVRDGIIEDIVEPDAEPILKKEEATKEEFEAHRAKQEARQAKREAHRAKLVANLENEKTAFELTLLCFTQLQRNLDTQFPESELS